MTGTGADLYEALVYNWGDAYEITSEGGSGPYTAARRDGLGTLTADSPAKLYDAVVEDYRQRPVPREFAL